MARLDREQIQAAIEKTLNGRYRIVAADVDGEEEEDDEQGAEVAGSALPASTLDAMRSKYADVLGKPMAPGKHLEKTSQLVVLEPDDDLVTDFKAPNRRVRVISSKTGEIVAEQG
jgi:hypothetical protein